jgi:hypothetical protein
VFPWCPSCEVISARDPRCGQLDTRILYLQTRGTGADYRARQPSGQVSKFLVGWAGGDSIRVKPS